MMIFDKDLLYKRTGWFSKDCEALVENLKRNGLVIVDSNECKKVNLDSLLREDDLR